MESYKRYNRKELKVIYDFLLQLPAIENYSEKNILLSSPRTEFVDAFDRTYFFVPFNFLENKNSFLSFSYFQLVESGEQKKEGLYAILTIDSEDIWIGDYIIRVELNPENFSSFNNFFSFITFDSKHKLRILLSKQKLGFFE